jgi:YidC/Oxa1 family membrane protein insertase
MEKRLILAVVLMIATVFIVNVMFPPPPPPEPPVVIEDAVTVPAEIADAVTETTAAAQQPAVVGQTQELPGLTAREEPGAEDTVWVTGPLYRIGFAQQGGRVVSAEMLQFESLAPETKGGPVELVPAFAETFFTHKWLVGDDTLDFAGVPFEIIPRNGVSLAEGGQPQTLTLSYQPDGVPFRLEIRYTFRPDNYVIDLVGQLDGVRATGWWMMGLGPGLQSNEWDPENDYRANLAFGGKGPEGVSSQKIVDVEGSQRVILDGPFDWTAVRTKYFVNALVPEDRRFGGLMIDGVPNPVRADGFASFSVPRDGRFEYTIYLGPQDYGRLKAVGHDLEQVTPYGYKWLQPVLRPLAGAITTLLVWMHRFLGLSYGWILIIFGIGIRVILFPLYQKSMRSQMATMRVQPLMKEIQEKYKNDPQKLQQEMMKLYREHKVNPLGGCLPMLLPFPILIALFFVFRDTIEFRGVSFLWLPDLSQPDPLYIIPVLMGASIFLLQWITQKSMPQSNPQMKMMMYIMPVMMVVLFLRFASGLNLYYATMNLASLPQQLYLAKERRAAANQPPPGKTAKAKT